MIRSSSWSHAARRALVVTVVNSLFLAASALASEGDSSAEIERPASESAELPYWSAPFLLPPAVLVPGFAHLFRGEKESALRLLSWTGASLGVFSHASALLIAAGAAEVAVVPLAPILLLSGSTYLALGLADWIGSYSAAGLPGSVGSRFGGSAWSSAHVVGAKYAYSNHESLRQKQFAGVTGKLRLGRFEYGLSGVGDSSLDYSAFGGDVAFLWRHWIQGGVAGEGLRFGVGLRQEGARTGGFQTFSMRYFASSILPMGAVAPTLDALTWTLSLGLIHAFTRYPDLPRKTHDQELLLAGGFEMQWAALGWLRPFWGYEHSREGLAGGSASGFLGHFRAGAELALPAGFWLVAQAASSRPPLYQAALERRW